MFHRYHTMTGGQQAAIFPLSAGFRKVLRRGVVRKYGKHSVSPIVHGKRPTGIIPYNAEREVDMTYRGSQFFMKTV